MWGMSLAVLLAQNNIVTALDIVSERVDKVNRKESPIQDDYIEKYLREKELNLRLHLMIRLLTAKLISLS